MPLSARSTSVVAALLAAVDRDSLRMDPECLCEFLRKCSLEPEFADLLEELHFELEEERFRCLALEGTLKHLRLVGWLHEPEPGFYRIAVFERNEQLVSVARTLSDPEHEAFAALCERFREEVIPHEG